MEDIFNGEAFQCLGREKIDILREMSGKAKGKAPMDILDLMTQYGHKLSGGKPLTQNDKQALILALRTSIDPQEQKRFDEAINMLKIMGKL